MLKRDNGKIESKSEEIPPLEDSNDEEIAYLVEGEALNKDDVEQEQENIFHT